MMKIINIIKIINIMKKRRIANQVEIVMKQDLDTIVIEALKEVAFDMVEYRNNNVGEKHDIELFQAVKKVLRYYMPISDYNEFLDELVAI